MKTITYAQRIETIRKTGDVQGVIEKAQGYAEGCRHLVESSENLTPGQLIRMSNAYREANKVVLDLRRNRNEIEAALAQQAA